MELQLVGEGCSGAHCEEYVGNVGRGSPRAWLPLCVSHCSAQGLPSVTIEFSWEMVPWAGPGGDDTRGHRRGSEGLGTLPILVMVSRVTCHQYVSQES